VALAGWPDAVADASTADRVTALLIVGIGLNTLSGASSRTSFRRLPVIDVRQTCGYVIAVALWTSSTLIDVPGRTLVPHQKPGDEGDRRAATTKDRA
jgi:hypothetical protein